MYISIRYFAWRPSALCVDFAILARRIPAVLIFWNYQEWCVLKEKPHNNNQSISFFSITYLKVSILECLKTPFFVHPMREYISHHLFKFFPRGETTKFVFAAFGSICKVQANQWQWPIIYSAKSAQNSDFFGFGSGLYTDNKISDTPQALFRIASSSGASTSRNVQRVKFLQIENIR